MLRLKTLNSIIVMLFWIFVLFFQNSSSRQVEQTNQVKYTRCWRQKIQQPKWKKNNNNTESRVDVAPAEGCAIFGILPFAVADAIISPLYGIKILIWLHITEAISRYHRLIKRNVNTLGKQLEQYLQSPHFVAIVFNFN